jgi:hypothetical protein
MRPFQLDRSSSGLNVGPAVFSLGPLAILLLDLAEEGCEFLIAFPLCILDVLIADLRTLQRVVENADEIVEAIACPCVCHLSTSIPESVSPCSSQK